MNYLKEAFVKYRTTKVALPEQGLTGPESAANLILQYCEDLGDQYDEEVEQVIALALDTANQVKSIQVIFKGTANSCPLSPREILRFALLQNATVLIVAHNHPTGNLEPSRNDIISTQALDEAADTVGIHLADHIIISNKNGGGYLSMKDQGVF